MNQIESFNSGVHQLPSDCYPPTDSDDESFVVLERSLPPESLAPTEISHLEILSPQVIDESLEMASDVLNNMTLTSSLPSAPSIPKVDLNKPNILNSITSVSSELSQDEIQQKVETLVLENYNLKETLHQNNMVMKNQYEILIKWQQDVEKVHESHKKKFLETKNYIQELKIENKRLANLLQKSSMGILNVDATTKDLSNEMEKLKIDQEEKSKQDELNQKQYEDEIIKQKEALRHAELQFESKEQKYLEHISALKCLNEKIVEDEKNKQKESLRNAELQLETKEQNYLEAKEALHKFELEFDTKEQEYLEQITALKCLNEKMISNLGNPEEVDILKKQLMAAQFCVTDLKESKKAIETEAEMNRNKITELEAVVMKLRSDADRTMALDEQLNLYKTDFEAELESKKKIILEKNKLAEDLFHIQRRNEGLLEEVETLRSKCSFVEVSNSGQQRSTTASAPPPQTAPPSPPQTTYICPLCMAKFRSYRILEEHVESCIENSA